MERCQLTMAGEIDMANAEDYLALARAIIAGCHAEADTCLTIDLSGVTFMSSSGLNMLVEVRRATTDAGMELRLVRILERVSQLLEITALTDHFGVANAGPVLA